MAMAKLVGTKGGSGVWQRIISEMPEHDVYIEPFWGRGTIAGLKRPAAITIGCDLDPAALSSGRSLGATMFRCCGIAWLEDYFHLVLPLDRATLDPAAVATFGGYPWSRHFVYLDPPYLGCGGYYKFELTDEQHRGLCRLFRRLPCPAAISGYHSRVYAEELAGCRLVRIPTVNRAGRRVIEHLWLNFDAPQRYHDVRFVGSGRRERERIRRRVKTWSAGLERMPSAERQAILDTLLTRTPDS